MIKITNIENSSLKLDEILLVTIDALEGVLASELFREGMMKIDFDVMIDKEKTTLTPPEIYKLTQGILEIETLRFYYRDSSVLGSAIESEGLIKLNTKHFRMESVANNAGVLIHEYLHLLGIDHDSSQDYDSIPYAVGHLVQRILRKYPYKAGKRLKRVPKGFPLCFLKEWRWK